MADPIAEESVRIRADTDGFEKGISSSAGKAGKKAGQSYGKSFRSSIGKIAIGAGVAAGVVGVAKGIKSVVTAAIEAEAQTTRAQASLQRFGLSGAKAAKAIETVGKQAEKLGFDDEQAAQSLGVLTRATGSLEKGQKALGLAFDYSRATGKGLEASTKAVALASLGNSRALKQLGVDVEKTTTNQDALKKRTEELRKEQKKVIDQAKDGTEAEKEAAAAEKVRLQGIIDRLKAKKDEAKALDKEASAKKALSTLDKTIGNQAEKFATTTAGKLATLGERFDNFKEQAGTALLPLVNTVLDKAVPALSKLGDAAGPKIQELAGIIERATPKALALAEGAKKIAEGLAPIAADAIRSVASAVETAAPYAKQFAEGLIGVGQAIGGGNLVLAGGVFLGLSKTLPIVAGALKAIRGAGAGAALTSIANPVTLIAAGAATAALGLKAIADASADIGEEAADAAGALDKLLAAQDKVRGVEQNAAQVAANLEDARTNLQVATTKQATAQAAYDIGMEKSIFLTKRGIDTDRTRVKLTDNLVEKSKTLRDAQLRYDDALERSNDQEKDTVAAHQAVDKASQELGKQFGGLATKAQEVANKQAIMAAGGAAAARGNSNVASAAERAAVQSKVFADELIKAAGGSDTLSDAARMLLGNVGRLIAKYDKVPLEKRTKIVADALAAGQTLDQLKAKLDRLQDETITITTVLKTLKVTGNTPPVGGGGSGGNDPKEAEKAGSDFAATFAAKSRKRLNIDLPKSVSEAIKNLKGAIQQQASALGDIIGDVLDKRLKKSVAQTALDAFNGSDAVDPTDPVAVRLQNARRAREEADFKKEEASLKALTTSTEASAEERADAVLRLEELQASRAADLRQQELERAAAVEEQKTEDAKAASKQRLDDLASALKAGAITEGEFNEAVAKELKSQGVTYKAIGQELGISFAEGFREMMAQLRADLGAFGLAPKVNAGSPLPTDSPIRNARESLREQQQELPEELKKVRNANEKLQQALAKQREVGGDPGAEARAVRNAREALEKAQQDVKETRTMIALLRQIVENGKNIQIGDVTLDPEQSDIFRNLLAGAAR